MSIGSIGNQNSIRDFFNAVEAARKRNGGMQGVVKSPEKPTAAPATAQLKSSIASLGTYSPYAHKTGSGVLSAAGAPVPAVRPRILGGFFDAYA